MLDLSEFKKKLDNLDSKGIDEYQIAKEIWDKNAKGDTFYEGLAFEFGEYPDGDGWGHFYGYQSAITLTNGKVYTNIAESVITEDAIKYWQGRIATSVSPIFKARFAGLVTDFGKRFDIKPNATLIESFINALVDIIKGNYCSDYGITKKIDILIKVATSWTKDENLKNKVVETILSCLESYVKLKKSGVGSIFKSIMGSELFTDAQKEKATRIVESLFKEIRDTQNNPWLLEDTATLLADAYGKGDARILPLFKDVEIAFKNVSKGVTGFQAQGWLQLVEKLYRKYGYKDEANRILAEIAGMGKRTLEGLQTFAQTFTIPKEKIEAFFASVHDSSLYGTPLENLVMFMIPDEKQAEVTLKESIKKDPLPFIMTTQLLDDKGRPLSVVGPIGDSDENSDISGHLVLEISKQLQFLSFYLNLGFKELKKEGIFNSIVVKQLYRKCPLFEEARYSVIDEAVIQYFIGNHLVFAHLMIPQIENALRNMLELMGVSTLKPQQGGKGNTLKTLDAVLREPKLEEVLKHDSVNYLRILLTDQRGWNLRNRVCHGMMSPNRFTYVTSDRIMHAFLLLCQVKLMNDV